MLTAAQTRQGYLNLWAGMSILAGRRLALNTVVAKIEAGRARYEAVEKETAAPWWFVGICHMRESSCNFATYLGNGEPLSRKTRLVPAGRGPFMTWEEGAIDALRFQGYAGLTDWDLATALFRFEAYNGWGYFYKGVNSPYVWGWTNEQQPGKYVADGVWSATAIDPQPGCAAMLRGLIDAGFATVAGADTVKARTAGTDGAATHVPGDDNAAPGADSGDRIALHIGSRGPDVLALQNKLRSLGYPVGAIDGAYGPGMADAVAAFQRRYGLKGDPGLWYASYDFVLASAESIVPESRATATPRSLEEQGDALTRVYRFCRNVVMWVATLFGISIGGESTVVQTVTSTHDAAEQVHSIASWAHGNAWIALLVVCVIFAAVFEYARLHRAKEYASGAFQGPSQKVEE